MGSGSKQQIIEWCGTLTAYLTACRPQSAPNLPSLSAGAAFAAAGGSSRQQPASNNPASAQNPCFRSIFVVLAKLQHSKGCGGVQGEGKHGPQCCRAVAAQGGRRRNGRSCACCQSHCWAVDMAAPVLHGVLERCSWSQTVGQTAPHKRSHGAVPEVPACRRCADFRARTCPP